MRFQKGHKKLGGRQKGAPNKATLIAQDISNTLGIDPLKILFLFAAGDWKALGYDNECYFSETAEKAIKMGYTITPEMRLSAAKEASQYVYPKKKEQIEDNEPIDVMSIEEKKQFLKAAEDEIKRLKEEINEVQELESSSDTEDD